MRNLTHLGIRKAKVSLLATLAFRARVEDSLGAPSLSLPCTPSSIAAEGTRGEGVHKRPHTLLRGVDQRQGQLLEVWEPREECGEMAQ